MPDDTDPDRAEVTLDLHCQRCGQTVTLTYTPTDRYRTGAWSCPNTACGYLQKIDLEGSIVRVTARTQLPTD